jgi:hypothetical protein
MNSQYSQLNNPKIINTELKGESSKKLIEVQNPLNSQPKSEPVSMAQNQLPPKMSKIALMQ